MTIASSDLISHEHNGIIIYQRREDGLINATAMCVAFNKDVSEWLKTRPTFELVEALANRLGIKPDPKSASKPNSLKTRVSNTYPALVITKRGSPQAGGGTWIHYKLGVPLAQWLSPEFALTVSDWVEEWLLTANNPISFQGEKPIMQFPVAMGFRERLMLMDLKRRLSIALSKSPGETHASLYRSFYEVCTRLGETEE